MPFILAATASALPQGLTGERLYDFCRDRDAPAKVAESHVCLGFIRGIIDGARLEALRTAGMSSPAMPAICEPPGATAGQAIALVLRYLEARPERRPQPAAVAVFQALGAAWPCKP